MNQTSDVEHNIPYVTLTIAGYIGAMMAKAENAIFVTTKENPFDYVNMATMKKKKKERENDKKEYSDTCG